LAHNNQDKKKSNFLNQNIYQIITNMSLQKVQKVQNQYQQAFETLKNCPSKRVTFYGGARTLESSENYQKIELLASKLGENGFGIVTGGGPGIMEAGLKGAKNVQATGVGFRLDLRNEAPKILGEIDILFTEFEARKWALRTSPIWVFAPGGFGTLDELMENLTLIITGKIEQKAIFLYNSSFWQGLLEWIKNTICEQNLAIKDFEKYFILTDDIDLIVQKSQEFISVDLEAYDKLKVGLEKNRVEM
jgi:uncharacterized protein (TIGR00730 family)